MSLILTKEELDITKERFKEYNHMCDIYNSDPRFKLFVDKECELYGIHKDILLLHKTVQEVGKYYEENPDGDEQLPPGLKKKALFDEDDKAC